MTRSILIYASMMFISASAFADFNAHCITHPKDQTPVASIDLTTDTAKINFKNGQRMPLAVFGPGLGVGMGSEFAIFNEEANGRYFLMVKADFFQSGTQGRMFDRANMSIATPDGILYFFTSRGNTCTVTFRPNLRR